MWWRPQGSDGLAGGEGTSSLPHLRSCQDSSYAACHRSSRFSWDSLVGLQGTVTFLGVRREGDPTVPFDSGTVQGMEAPGEDNEDLEGRPYKEEEERSSLSLDLPIVG